MKPLLIALLLFSAVAVSAGNVDFEKHKVAISKIAENAELQSAFDLLTKAEGSTPPQRRAAIKLMIESGNLEVRLLAHAIEPSIALTIEESTAKSLEDAYALAAVFLSSSMPDGLAPGGEEEVAKEGLMLRLSKLLEMIIEKEATGIEIPELADARSREAKVWIRQVAIRLKNLPATKSDIENFAKKLNRLIQEQSAMAIDGAPQSAMLLKQQR